MMVAFGLTFSQSGYALLQLEDPNGFGLSKEEGSWFASVLIMGCMFGSTLGGLKSELIGRRKSILVDCISYIIITFRIFIYDYIFYIWWQDDMKHCE